MTAKNVRRIALLVVVIVALIFCATKFAGKPADVLTIVVVPGEEEIALRARYQLLVDYLSDRMDVDMELMTVSSYVGVVEAMKYNHADIALFGASNYVMAAREAEIEPLVASIRGDTGKPGYFAYIISRPDLETLEGATFAYVDPGSSSGYLYPNNYIETSGIQLGKIMFAGSHPAVIEAVKNGSVDAGAVASHRWTGALREGVITEDTIKIFWSSVIIPSGPWAMRSALGEDLRKSFVEAMLNMPEDVLSRFSSAKELEFVRVLDSDYDVVRDLFPE